MVVSFGFLCRVVIICTDTLGRHMVSIVRKADLVQVDDEVM